MGQYSGLEEKLAFGTDTLFASQSAPGCGKDDKVCFLDFSYYRGCTRWNLLVVSWTARCLDQVIATDLRVYYEQRGDGTARFQR